MWWRKENLNSASTSHCSSSDNQADSYRNAADNIYFSRRTLTKGSHSWILQPSIAKVHTVLFLHFCFFLSHFFVFVFQKPPFWLLCKILCCILVFLGCGPVLRCFCPGVLLFSVARQAKLHWFALSVVLVVSTGGLGVLQVGLRNNHNFDARR